MASFYGKAAQKAYLDLKDPDVEVNADKYVGIE